MSETNMSIPDSVYLCDLMNFFAALACIKTTEDNMIIPWSWWSLKAPPFGYIKAYGRLLLSHPNQSQQYLNAPHNSFVVNNDPWPAQTLVMFIFFSCNIP